MAEAPFGSDPHTTSTLGAWTRKVPEEVVAVARSDGVWEFKIEFQDSTTQSSPSIRDALDNHLGLKHFRSVHIKWAEQWVYDIPADLEGDGIRNLTRTLDTMIDASEDVVWLPEWSSYAVGDSPGNHLCLERACLDSKGTQCPKVTIGDISQQLADRVGINGNGRTEVFKDAVEHLGKVVQDTYIAYPNDPSRMTAAIIGLASSNNPFRRLMQV